MAPLVSNLKTNKTRSLKTASRPKPNTLKACLDFSQAGSTRHPYRTQRRRHPRDTDDGVHCTLKIHNHRHIAPILLVDTDATTTSSTLVAFMGTQASPPRWGLRYYLASEPGLRFNLVPNTDMTQSMCGQYSELCAYKQFWKRELSSDR